MAGVDTAPPYTWRSHSTSINTDTFVLITVSPVPCTDPSSAAAGLQCSFITTLFTRSISRFMPLTTHTQ